MATILTKKSDTSSSVPLAADLTNAAGGAELAVNTADKRLYSKTSGGSVVELGTNPSSMTLPNGTANGVPYLNGSKVLTSGSALTFDGTGLGIGTGTIPAGRKLVIDSGNIRLSNDYQIEWGGSTVGLYGNGSTNSLSFFANTSEQMRLTSTGLGIGTSSPNYSLTSYKGGAVANYLQVASGATGAGSGNGLLLGVDASGNGVINAQGAVSLNTYVAGVLRTTIDSSGNLGLGVTPSASTLPTIQSTYGVLSGNNNITLVCNAYYNGGFKYTATGAATYYQHDAGKHIWYTAPSGTAGNAISFNQAMTLDASGNLLVGTTSTNGVGWTLSPSGSGQIRSSGTSSQDKIQFANSNGVVGAITTNGSSTSYFTSSDYRLKENIQPMTGALAKLAALKPVTYKWKADGSDGEGFIAHELAEVCPAAVTGEKDAVDKDGKPKYQGIDVSFLVGTLTAAIQELKAEFDAYKATHP